MGVRHALLEVIGVVHGDVAFWVIQMPRIKKDECKHLYRLSKSHFFREDTTSWLKCGRYIHVTIQADCAIETIDNKVFAIGCRNELPRQRKFFIKCRLPVHHDHFLQVSRLSSETPCNRSS